MKRQNAENSWKRKNAENSWNKQIAENGLTQESVRKSKEKDIGNVQIKSPKVNDLIGNQRRKRLASLERAEVWWF